MNGTSTRFFRFFHTLHGVCDSKHFPLEFSCHQQNQNNNNNISSPFSQRIRETELIAFSSANTVWLWQIRHLNDICCTLLRFSADSLAHGPYVLVQWMLTKKVLIIIHEGRYHALRWEREHCRMLMRMTSMGK